MDKQQQAYDPDNEQHRKLAEAWRTIVAEAGENRVVAMHAQTDGGCPVSAFVVIDDEDAVAAIDGLLQGRAPNEHGVEDETAQALAAVARATLGDIGGPGARSWAVEGADGEPVAMVLCVVGDESLCTLLEKVVRSHATGRITVIERPAREADA